MSGWMAVIVGVGCAVGFLAIGVVAVYCVEQIVNQDAKYRCPTCGHPTHHDRKSKEWTP